MTAEDEIMPVTVKTFATLGRSRAAALPRNATRAISAAARW